MVNTFTPEPREINLPDTGNHEKAIFLVPLLMSPVLMLKDDIDAQLYSKRIVPRQACPNGSDSARNTGKRVFN